MHHVLTQKLRDIKVFNWESNHLKLLARTRVTVKIIALVWTLRVGRVEWITTSEALCPNAVRRHVSQVVVTKYVTYTQCHHERYYFCVALRSGCFMLMTGSRQKVRVPRWRVFWVITEPFLIYSRHSCVHRWWDHSKHTFAANTHFESVTGYLRWSNRPGGDTTSDDETKQKKKKMMVKIWDQS